MSAVTVERSSSPHSLKEALVKQANMTHEFTLGRRKITVYLNTSPEPSIDLDGFIENVRGGKKFNVVVDFGRMFDPMNDSEVPTEKRWTEDNHPENVHFLDFGSDEDQQVAVTNGKTIEDIVNNPLKKRPFLDLADVKEYALTMIDTFNRMMKAAPIIPGSVGLGIARAGLPTTEMLGIKQEDQVVVDAKRLNDLQHPSHLLVGLKLNLGDLKKLQERDLIIGEGAVATGASELSILLTALALDIKPKSVTSYSFASTQLGSDQLSTSIAQLNKKLRIDIKFNLYAARCSFKMTGGKHPFYLLTDDGKYMVGDVGDFLDSFVRLMQWRKLWPPQLTEPLLRSFFARLSLIRDGIFYLNGNQKAHDLSQATGKKLDFNTLLQMAELAEDYGLPPYQTGIILNRENQAANTNSEPVAA